MLPEPPQLHFPSPYERPHLAPSHAEALLRPDGARIAAFCYGEWGAWSKDPASAPVVFLHGNGEEHGIFGPQIDAICAAGHPAIGIDSRGQGRSTRGTKHLTYELFCQDALAVLDAWGLGCVHVVGFSDGGIEALLLARDCPGRILSCMAIGANLEPEGVDGGDWDVHATAEALLAWAQAAEALEEQSGIDAELLTPTASEARTSADLLLLMEEEPHIEAASLAAISCPVTIMAGEHDAIRPEETARIARAVPASVLRIVAGCGHTLPKEAASAVTEAALETIARSFARPQDA